MRRVGREIEEGGREGGREDDISFIMLVFFCVCVCLYWDEGEGQSTEGEK